MLTFQQLIAKLSSFWEAHGCVLHHGHDLEVGAGTFNPVTFLRCLGPEPYRAAYVEPSRRPQDGRYGENPNRMQLFHQYQVILKPSPPDIQKLYLESLAAVGLKLKQHDIRFVHNDWESPSLGAWGLGWEVWCDGMEITQFTYFQAMASLPLNPITAEITYGLERLALFIQNVESFYDIRWNEQLTLRDIIYKNEVEWSIYNFEASNRELWLRHFNDFEEEAKQLITRGLPLPAYDFIVKASHAFNMLEARGAVSPTERTGYLGRLRDLARQVAVVYLATREALHYPLLSRLGETKQPKVVHKPWKAPKLFSAKKRRDFSWRSAQKKSPPLICPQHKKAWRDNSPSFSEETGLAFKALHTYATPRRLAIHVEGLVEGTSPKLIERRGPQLTMAFDSAGKPTKQGEGFLRASQLKSPTLQELRKGKFPGIAIRAVKEVEYLFSLHEEPGHSTLALLHAFIPKLIAGIDFPKRMRWNSTEATYTRPIRWLVALFGKEIVPCQVAGIQAGRLSGKITLSSAESYLTQLKKGSVMASVQERKSAIVKQLRALESRHKCKVLEEATVLQEVLFLTEWPKLTLGSFDKSFLRAPQEILISEMVEHQKYFPLGDSKGQLRNQFVITCDTTPNDLIRRGNERVLSARLSDGVFLYEQDLKVPLHQLNDRLAHMTYQSELGSMLNKVERLTSHAQKLNQLLKLADSELLVRAAQLCKADLASHVVGEFPQLQGVMGRALALAQHEEKEVALALEEHWMPRSESSPLPKTPCGILLSLADKFDNLMGSFALGLKPTSSSDPYALRRQTLGIVRILVDKALSLNLREALEACATSFPQLKETKERERLIQELLVYITGRTKTVLEDDGLKSDEIEAALQGAVLDPYDLWQRVKALHDFRSRGKEFAKLYEVYKRSKGQLEGEKGSVLHPALLKEAAEQALMNALNACEPRWKTALAARDYQAAFSELARLQPPLARLFDTVKIQVEDVALRQNRIALLRKVFAYFEPLLDFAKIQEK